MAVWVVEDCIRCGGAPAVDGAGYCGSCHWAVRAELEEGCSRMYAYLRGWASFSEWCRARGQSPFI